MNIIILLHLQEDHQYLGVLDIKKSSFLMALSYLLEFSVIRKASSVIDLQLGERFASVCQFLQLFLSLKREFCFLLRIHHILL